MSTMDLPCDVLAPHVIGTFPDTHVTTSGAAPSNAPTTLKRTVYVTDAKAVTPGVRTLNKAATAQLLALIDANLGHFYQDYGSAIYPDLQGPSAEWRDCKVKEMHTAGLVYVVYHEPDDPARTPVAFVSLLLTHEPEFTGNPLVLYVYEIHVTDSARGHGLGTWLMRDVLTRTMARLQKAFPGHPGFRGVELTVFAANAPAIRFYLKRLRMSVAPWSAPVDFPAQTQLPPLNSRRTRSSIYHYQPPAAVKLQRRHSTPVYHILFWSCEQANSQAH
ncbi:LADA_0G11892g1_1 [Lachancea dasiensis]|uniref:N-alpha-acetyltransferase 40 n=1 Tax=Lachancea dasiensis TaxID=1072105 RepID=A0A1G4JVB2_9SACH|nr:LADA_0G11892g1_1 [Lachancea dasiensis]